MIWKHELCIDERAPHHVEQWERDHQRQLAGAAVVALLVANQGQPFTINYTEEADLRPFGDPRSPWPCTVLQARVDMRQVEIMDLRMAPRPAFHISINDVREATPRQMAESLFMRSRGWGRSKLRKISDLVAPLAVRMRPYIDEFRRGPTW